MSWLTLILALPTESATPRMRAWRALKSSGAAVLRDGVYLLPESPAHEANLRAIADDVTASGGQAWMLRTQPDAATDFTHLFDRSPAYAELMDEIRQATQQLHSGITPDTTKQVRRLRKLFAQLLMIDFFPGEAKTQTDAALRELETLLARTLNPDEPHVVHNAIPRLAVAGHRGRTWATRARPWVDRLASAWLIHRFIDTNAHILWIASPKDCPPDALGFDFDGATFSHVDARVTFETLLAAFDLETPALKRIGAIVHFLDVGGLAPPEAGGIEQVLRGLRDSIGNDDQLLATASLIFDGLHAAFSSETNA